MKTNYQIQTDILTQKLGESRPRLLLQCCCAPCSSYVLEYLCQFFDVKILFYNPNIFPRTEYEKRLVNLENLVEKYGGEVKVLDCEYDAERFEELAEGLENEPEGGARCTKCISLRLRETAKQAKSGDFDYFCTTLTVSPHKDADRINTIGLELAEEFGVKWLPSDFKKREGYKRSIELSTAYDLYRQDYCGCSYSKGDS